MKRTTISRRLIWSLCAFAALAAPLRAAEYRWVGDGVANGGDFNRPLWSRGSPGSADYLPGNAGPPGAGDTAFTQGANLTAAGGTVGVLNIEGGTFTVAEGTFTANTVRSTGTITGGGTLSAGVLGVEGEATRISGGNVAAAELLGGATVENTGTLRVLGTPVSEVALAPGDVLTVDPGSTVAVGNGAFGAAGTVRVGANARLAGQGTVRGNVIVAENGSLAPGGDGGTLMIEGDYDQTGARAGVGSMDVEVGGDDPEKGYVRLAVSGRAKLGGPLNLHLLNGYVPGKRAKISILRAGGIKSSFYSLATPGFIVKAKQDEASFFLRNKAVSPGLPVQTSAVEAGGTQGEPFSYRIEATNNPDNFSLGALPAGLSLNPNTGVISGTPVVAGNFVLNFVLGNNQATGTGLLRLRIASGVPVAPPPPPEEGTVVSVATEILTAFAEEHSVARFLVTRSEADAAADLVVGYTLKGTAKPGVHYKALPGSVTIPAGATTAKITVKPLDKNVGGGVRTLKLTLDPGENYSVGTASSAKVKIVEVD